MSNPGSAAPTKIDLATAGTLRTRFQAHDESWGQELESLRARHFVRIFEARQNLWPFSGSILRS